MCPFCNTSNPADSVVAHMKAHDPSLSAARALGLYYSVTVGNPTEYA